MRLRPLTGPLLALGTLGLFAHLIGAEFVYFDDPIYVTENPQVRAGLSLEGVRWAFTTFYAANWFPLTWLSLMLDSSLYGGAAAGFHATNLALHAANVWLLFVVLRSLTGRWWESAFVAALFAVHPLHVESVAWITERKGLLSTCFGLLAIGSYARYARAGGGRWLAAGVLSFACSLLAKQALITLPFLLLLLDYWPLGRVASGAARDRPGRLLLEKLPFLALTLGAGVVALLTQQAGGSVGSTGDIPVSVRAANAISVYGIYLAKTLVPTGLCVYYPHPYPRAPIPALEVAGGALLIILASALVLWQLRRRPYLGVGWLWYLGTLVPVIGLVQIGGQRMADRYSYVPLIGLFIAITWLASDWVGTRTARRRVAAIAATTVLLTLSVASYRQAGYWQNNAALFGRALAVTERNQVAHAGLARALYEQRRHQDAIFHLRQALEIHPPYFEARIALGTALRGQARVQEAIAHLEVAREIDPESPQVHYELGLSFSQQHRYNEAIAAFRRALRAGGGGSSYDPRAAHEIARTLSKKDQPERAVESYLSVVGRWPELAEAHRELAELLIEQGEPERAREHLREALRLRADFPEAQRTLERLPRD